MIILYLTTSFSFISSKFFICLVWCKQVFLSYFSGTECLRWLVIVRYDVLMRFFNYHFIKLRKIPYFITPLHRVFIYRKNTWFSTYLLFLLSFFYLGLFLVSELVVGRIKWLGNTGNSRVLKIWFCFPLKNIFLLVVVVFLHWPLFLYGYYFNFLLRLKSLLILHSLSASPLSSSLFISVFLLTIFFFLFLFTLIF